MKNRNVRCGGRSVVRDHQNNPILDADNARQYKPCEAYAANGTPFCGKHGGQLEPTIAAAKRRLLWGADDMVEVLHRIARDELASHADRIKAINSILDRAGIRPGVDVSLETPKWQKVLSNLFGSPDDPEDEGEDEVEVPPPARKHSSRKASPPKASAKASPPVTFEGW